MTPDLPFLLDCEAMANFVSGLRIDAELRGRVERIRCDVFDMLKPYRAEEKKAARKKRMAVSKQRMFAEAL